MKLIVLRVFVTSVIIVGSIYYLLAIILKGNNSELRDVSVDPLQDSLLAQEIPASKLRDAQGREIAVSDQYLIGRNLFIFFSPHDCPTCLREAKYWQIFYEKNISTCSVSGVIQGKHLNYLKRFKVSYGLTFPIFIDSNAEWFTELAISQTPLKILVDKNGKILKIGHTVFKNYTEFHDFIVFD